MWSKGFLVFFLILCALFSASRLVHLMLYGTILAIALFSWGTGRAFARVRVIRTPPKAKAFPGQPVEITVVAENGSRLPIGWLQLTAARQPNLVVLGVQAAAGLVPGRGRLELIYRVAGMRRGHYRLGGIRAAGGDPLGWATLERVFPDEGEGLTVYPRTWPLSELPLPATLPFGRRRHWLRAYEDPSWVAGIRDYSAGDSLRRIHWRATARLGHLQVKELTPTVAAEGWIFLDLAEEHYPAGTAVVLGEMGIEVAASFLVYLHERGTAVGFASNGRTPTEAGEGPVFVPADPGAEGAETILTLLAGIELGEGMDFAELVAEYGRNTSHGSALFLLTPAWSEELTRVALGLRRLGRIVLPVFLGQVREGGAAAARAGFPVMTARRLWETGGVVIGRA